MSPLRAAVAGVVLAVAGGAASASEPWYVPDHAKLQLAGNIGFLSPGVGYAWAGGRLEGDAFFGWVPGSIAGEDIFALTGKLTWLPWKISVGRRWLLRPLSAALQLTYTFGGEYFVVPPERYEDGYYDFQTAIHAGLGFGGSVARKGRGALRELGVYWELVALDSMLFLWLRNRRELGPDDAFTLALGVRASF